LGTHYLFKGRTGQAGTVYAPAGLSPVAQWSLTSLCEKLLKIGAKIVRHARYVIFQMAEVAVPRELFDRILQRIDGLRRRPVPTPV